MSNVFENSTYPPLFTAKSAGETRKLLAEGADPNSRCNLGRTALCFAKSPQQAEILLRAGADINGNELTSPLHHVSDPATLLFLIQRGADVNRLDHFRQTPIFRAGNSECAELLVRYGAKTEVFDLFGLTPLHYASTRGIAELLLRHGADVNSHTKNGPYPMECIPNFDVLQFLLEQGGRVPFRKKGNLFNYDKSFPRVALYLQAGANPDMRNNWGRTVLHGVNDPATFDLMVRRYGANVNCRDSLGKTPLFYVKNVEMLRCFLDCSALVP